MFTSENEARAWATENGWRVVEVLYTMRGVRLNLRKGNRVRTLRVN
jgi:hypothetical protein